MSHVSPDFTQCHRLGSCQPATPNTTNTHTPSTVDPQSPCVHPDKHQSLALKETKCPIFHARYHLREPTSTPQTDRKQQIPDYGFWRQTAKRCSDLDSRSVMEHAEIPTVMTWEISSFDKSNRRQATTPRSIYIAYQYILTVPTYKETENDTGHYWVIKSVMVAKQQSQKRNTLYGNILHNILLFQISSVVKENGWKGFFMRSLLACWYPCVDWEFQPLNFILIPGS